MDRVYEQIGSKMTLLTLEHKTTFRTARFPGPRRSTAAMDEVADFGLRLMTNLDATRQLKQGGL